ncbi:hypothetical protein K458DRAFT_339090 [Lentithecium fluviatile CBS 122367]|uniref:AAA+ ATPase domain-containing protein n=1 Tax=Lentithecium fluviatile CBS 122367 TaxID=1168545 RepID=A0A6G1J0F2_9PLEO|nr:hypothetical protein K458DRAFT_339090 [Lentithecium fluviatile CBS 122367]
MEAGESSKAKAAAAVEAASTGSNLNSKPEKAGGEKDAKASLVKGGEAKKKEKEGKKGAKRSKKMEESEMESSDSSDEESDVESSDDERERRKRVKARKVAEKKAKLRAKMKAKAKKKSKKVVDFSDEESDDSSSESEPESEEEKAKRKRKAKTRKRKASKKYESSSSESSASSSSSSDSSSEDEKKRRKRSSKKKSKHSKKKATEASSSSSSSESEAETKTTATTTTDTTTTDATAAATAATQDAKLKAAMAALQLGINPATLKTTLPPTTTTVAATPVKPKKKNALEFKRVDQVWDSKIRDYKYTESVEEKKDEFDSVFTVRRRFGWDNKYLETHVDIKSKLLRGSLQEVFRECKSISLVEDKPSIQPNILFHYYDEIKTHVRKTLKPKLQRAKKRKDRKQLEQQIAQCKLLLKYIDEDYEDVRKTLKPMLKAGTITYNLVWALFKPNTIAYTPTYGNKDDPRCFKVDYCYEEEDWFGNKKWDIEGRYLEYDGKVFGLGDHFVQIAAFKGHKKIANLPAYPLDHHKDPETLREQLVERGKKFVSLQGQNYRVQNGLGYMKVKRTVQKFEMNGRVMVDPATFRRINANYPLSYIKQDELGQEGDGDDSDDGCGCGSESENEDEGEKPNGRRVMWKDNAGKKHLIHIPPGDEGPDITSQKLDAVEDESDEVKHVFTEEELLIASPVVLGFSFSEKVWLEFSLSGIEDIEWNNEAFDSLVLQQHIKQNLKGLVSSHRFNAAKTIDDVIVGKGKGLNVVLHGPPGVGKTLTGESIAEYLRCPLYAVSSGELGTNAAQLERDLNRIMDITHSWGAILLLDEADVFLEARQPHDIHRNALVSVFLRLTEYYQGILFLTTNRVATFDEAFQSRIHMGIRYENLTAKARKKIWQHHVGKVLAMTGDDEHRPKAFHDDDYNELSKKAMNGRQIKNAVKTSQSIAISEKGVFGMEYIKRVMEQHESFEEDMKGGLGYRDAMRQYT